LHILVGSPIWQLFSNKVFFMFGPLTQDYVLSAPQIPYSHCSSSSYCWLIIKVLLMFFYSCLLIYNNPKLDWVSWISPSFYIVGRKCVETILVKLVCWCGVCHYRHIGILFVYVLFHSFSFFLRSDHLYYIVWAKEFESKIWCCVCPIFFSAIILLL